MTADALVVAEHRDGDLREVTFEAIQAGAGLFDGTTDVALVAPEPDALADQLDLAAVETVHTFAHPGSFSHDVTVQVLERLATDGSYSAVIAGHTATGLDYLPAVAERLDWPLATDLVGIELEDDRIVATRERFGSKVEATVAIERTPAVLTIRPGEWATASEPGSPGVERVELDVDTDAVRATVTGYDAAAEGGVDITDADVIVSVGRGIGEEENLSLIEDLAEALDATVAASRPIVDAGWLPKNRQVGQSGASVSPSVYIAIGISGAVQHVAGIKGADTVVAINDDPNAPIFEVADVGIVDDLFEVVPALIEEFEDA